MRPTVQALVLTALASLACSGMEIPSPEAPAEPEPTPEPEPAPVPEPAPASFVVPTPDDSWPTASLRGPGLRLRTAPGATATEDGDGARIALPTSGARITACTDFADRVASTKGSLAENNDIAAHTLLDDATAFVWRNGENEAAGCQVLASHTSGDRTWCLNTDAPAEGKVATFSECGALVAIVRSIEARPADAPRGGRGKRN